MIYPDINPIALDLGFVKIYWYGIMPENKMHSEAEFLFWEIC